APPAAEAARGEPPREPAAVSTEAARVSPVVLPAARSTAGVATQPQEEDEEQEQEEQDRPGRDLDPLLAGRRRDTLSPVDDALGDHRDAALDPPPRRPARNAGRMSRSWIWPTSPTGRVPSRPCTV